MHKVLLENTIRYEIRMVMLFKLLTGGYGLRKSSFCASLSNWSSVVTSDERTGVAPFSLK
jgi:hypothetical protein